MNYGISELSIIPVRKEPSERSEMVTQILFGEHFTVLDETAGWLKVKLAWDGYEGWVDRKMVVTVSEKMNSRYESSSFAVTGDMVNLISVDKANSLMLVAGSTLPLWNHSLNQFDINDKLLEVSGEVFEGNPQSPRDVILKQAVKYLNAPYLWGGRTPFGIDCSGFTQIIYKMAGVRIPRDASYQVNMGVALSFAGEAKPGDLAFFDDEEGNIVHVGIILNNNRIIHSSGKVRIDNLDQYGIFNAGMKRYTHKLRVMKKILISDETD
jgi:gamma-D-glutamyl-L-lysine dipeptidyl-peptidase